MIPESVRRKQTSKILGMLRKQGAPVSQQAVPQTGSVIGEGTPAIGGQWDSEDLDMTDDVVKSDNLAGILKSSFRKSRKPTVAAPRRPVDEEDDLSYE